MTFIIDSVINLWNCYDFCDKYPFVIGSDASKDSSSTLVTSPPVPPNFLPYGKHSILLSFKRWICSLWRLLWNKLLLDYIQFPPFLLYFRTSCFRGTLWCSDKDCLCVICHRRTITWLNSGQCDINCSVYGDHWEIFSGEQYAHPSFLLLVEWDCNGCYTSSHICNEVTVKTKKISEWERNL